MRDASMDLGISGLIVSLMTTFFLMVGEDVETIACALIGALIIGLMAFARNWILAIAGTLLHLAVVGLVRNGYYEAAMLGSLGCLVIPFLMVIPWADVLELVAEEASLDGNQLLTQPVTWEMLGQRLWPPIQLSGPVPVSEGGYTVGPTWSGWSRLPACPSCRANSLERRLILMPSVDNIFDNGIYEERRRLEQLIWCKRCETIREY